MKKRIYMLCLATVCLFSGCGSVTKQPEVTEQVEDKKESDETLIQKAIACIKEKKYPQAMGLLMKTNGNKQAEELLEQLRYLLSGTYFVNLDIGVVAVDNNGNVQMAMDPASAVYDDYVECRKWKNIVSISEAEFRLDALDRDGKIHLTKDTDSSSKEIIDRLKSYRNVSKMDTEFDNYVVLSKMGKVYTYSSQYDFAVENYREQVDTLTDVVDIVSGQTMMAVLRRDGTVYVANYNKPVDEKVETTSDSEEKDSMDSVIDREGMAMLYDEVSEWTDIVDISCDNDGSIAGLKSDGTVVVSTNEANGREYFSHFDVSDWKDIIAISNNGDSLLGLKRDGTVVATGNDDEGRLDVSDWKDIVAISIGDWISIGLKSDGTLVVAGKEKEPEKPDVSGVNNLYVPTIQYEQYENKEK